jgi:hypothetical protein
MQVALSPGAAFLERSRGCGDTVGMPQERFFHKEGEKLRIDQEIFVAVAIPVGSINGVRNQLTCFWAGREDGGWFLNQFADGTFAPGFAAEGTSPVDAAAHGS